MDISSSNRMEPGLVRDLHQLQDVEQERRKTQASSRPETARDGAIISDRGQLLRRLDQAVRDAPDVREDKVAALREAIQQGRYPVSAPEIAQALLASRGT